ncbi:cytochrome P450 [Salipiger sp. 1_MG-2023]|uniref:cytochrome P450 n=1 Tax=Salipiger sp. 1_MG-2023 TaxID=3062665 RepID=UPI0026E436CD|nr:cytochrome P450 [Salipiger sp. 1_MG-2023]MDO6585586.1 cytochrome P450 [Salipiger sp. 1_MG-2023]
MHSFAQSPNDPGFVQDPYQFYDRLRAAGDLAYWPDYDLICATSHRAVHALLRDRRFGREIPAELARPVPEHLRPFYRIEDHSMLELEAPRHTRLRGLVLRAFTSRRIAALGPEIAALAHRLIDDMPQGDVDLLTAFCQPIPVIVIARLLGVPDDMAPQLLRWSNDMVALYQARRSRAIEDAAASAAAEFAAFLEDYIAQRRNSPREDLLSQLIAAEEAGERLSTDELIATCVLLLNAGHEATVHTLGNGIKALLETGTMITTDTAAPITEEIMRFDPPLHLFTRYAYEDADLYGHVFRRGDKVALMLGAAGRDPQVYAEPHRFDPTREARPHLAFGGGAHFCVGAPLARLELVTALPILFDRLPGLELAEPPRYADLYHFHGLERLMVRR